MSPRMLLFLVPGYLQSTTRHGDKRDGLELTRQVWMSFTSALILIGVVVLFIATTPTGSGTPWAVGLAVATVVLHAAVTWALSKPLSCADLAALAGSYRTRFFLTLAFSQAIALLAFVAAVVVGRWSVYWAFVPFALIGNMRAAPTRAHLAAEQEKLRSSGCSLSLVRALRTPAPT